MKIFTESMKASLSFSLFTTTVMGKKNCLYLSHRKPTAYVYNFQGMNAYQKPSELLFFFTACTLESFWADNVKHCSST